MAISHKWQVMIVVSIGTFMATLDAGIVNVALPTIADLFDASLSTLEWVVVAYLLTITTTLLMFGRLSDMTGGKKVYNIGFIIFIIGSALCGLATSALLLVAFRVVQAIGASMIMANAPGIIVKAFPESERGKALGLIGTVVAAGTTVGPALGGLLVGELSWRYIFFINVPIGIAGALMVRSVIQEQEYRRGQSFDFAGGITFMVGMLCVMLGLSKGQDLGWTSSTIVGFFILGAIFFIIFIVVERRTDHPMIELNIFRNRMFTMGNIAGFISYSLMFTAFILPFYVEDILGYKPTEVGLLLTPLPLILSVVSPASGHLSDKIGVRIPTTVGMLIVCTGMLWLSLLSTTSTYIDLVLGLILLGIGQGMFTSPNTSAVMGSVPRSKVGIAGGMISLVRNMGFITGVALCVAIFTNRMDYYTSIVSASSPGSSHKTIFTRSMSDVFKIGAAVSFIGVIITGLRAFYVVRANSQEAKKQ